MKESIDPLAETNCVYCGIFESAATLIMRGSMWACEKCYDAYEVIEDDYDDLGGST
jgi:hypothetical protein